MIVDVVIVASDRYQLAPRAMILRRDQAAVRSIADLKRLLRSNGYDGKAKAAVAAAGGHDDVVEEAHADSGLSPKVRQQTETPVFSPFLSRASSFGKCFAVCLACG